VRFVFFSGLTKEETSNLADRANTSGVTAKELASSKNHRGIGRLRRPSRQFELERDQWDEMRPSAFHPLDSRARIDNHLDMECEIYSAMPGSEESLILAQKLGIGRFVPCFLLFSDIGNPIVRLFPVANRSPEHIFTRLRSWIDEFYEINNRTLRRWTEVEKRITTNAKDSELPFSRLRLGRTSGSNVGGHCNDSPNILQS